MSDFSMLNYDLLGEIALKLDAIEDFVYFSIVCRSWNHASLLVKPKWKPSLPSLLLTENLEEKPRRKIFSLDNDRCYELGLPQTSGARCWGSSHGWLVTLNLSRDLHLFNPYTKARIQLPSQLTFPSHEEPLDDPDEDALYNRQSSIRKAIVVKSNDDDLIVLAIHSSWKWYLAFARPGDERWTSIVPPWPVKDVRYAVPITHRAADVISRDHYILILYEDAAIAYVDISDLSKSSSVTSKTFMPYVEGSALQGRLNKSLLEMYLVESFRNLFLVLRNKSCWADPNTGVDVEENYKTIHFEVFGIDFEKRKWEEVEELGDVALFVGDNHSLSVRASASRNCKSNCIYFTDDCVENWDLAAKLGGHDMGVYNLDNGQIQKFYEGDDVRSNVCTPFWFMPQF